MWSLKVGVASPGIPQPCLLPHNLIWTTPCELVVVRSSTHPNSEVTAGHLRTWARMASTIMNWKVRLSPYSYVQNEGGSQLTYTHHSSPSHQDFLTSTPNFVLGFKRLTSQWAWTRQAGIWNCMTGKFNSLSRNKNTQLGGMRWWEGDAIRVGVTPS